MREDWECGGGQRWVTCRVRTEWWLDVTTIHDIHDEIVDNEPHSHHFISERVI